MKIAKLMEIAIFTASLSLGVFALAEETTLEKAETLTNEAADGVKSTYREAKDKTCEMINGKLECVGQKVKNKALNAKDKVSTKATEAKNKID